MGDMFSLLLAAATDTTNDCAQQAADADEAFNKKEYEAGCGLFDLGCRVNEFFVRIMIRILRWVADVLGWAMDVGSLTTTDPTACRPSIGWGNSMQMFTFWLGVAGVAIVVLVGMIGIVQGMVLQKRDIIMRAVLGVAFAVPASLLSMWFIGLVLDFVDSGLSGEIVKGALGEKDMAQAALTIFTPSCDSANKTAADVGKCLVDAMGGGSYKLGTFMLFIMLVIVGVLFVIVINAIRGLMLQVLLAVSPLAFAMMPLGFGREVISAWGKMVAAFIVMKPLLVTYMSMMMSGVIRSGFTFFDANAIVYMLGLVFVILVPFMVMQLFAFLGLQFDHGREAHSLAGRGAQAGLGRFINTRAAAGGAGVAAGAAAGLGGAALGGRGFSSRTATASTTTGRSGSGSKSAASSASTGAAPGAAEVAGGSRTVEPRAEAHTSAPETRSERSTGSGPSRPARDVAPSGGEQTSSPARHAGAHAASPSSASGGGGSSAGRVNRPATTPPAVDPSPPRPRPSTPPNPPAPPTRRRPRVDGDRKDET